MPDRPPPHVRPAAAATGAILCLALLLAVLAGEPRRAHRLETTAPGTSQLAFGGELLTPRPYEAELSAPLVLTAPAAAPATAPTTTTTGPPPSTTAAPATTSRPRPTATTAPAATVWPVGDVEAWNRAVVAARPGDTIKLVATINQPLQYRGSLYQPENQKGTDGTAARPITITAAPGVWIDPGDESNNRGALDVVFTTNVNVVGIRVRHSQFGIRIMQASGTAATPLVVRGNTVTDIGHAGIYVGGNWDTHAPSRYVRVEGNRISRTGLVDPEYGEGVYLGYGAREWVDETSNLTVVDNDISYTGAEGIDIKPGVRHVVVQGNTVHDLSPIAGGAISACYVGAAPDPKPGQSADIVIRRNRIWNLDLDDRPGANSWAIWVGHGGVTVEANVVWGLPGDPTSTRAVRVRSPVAFGGFPIRITDNVFWTATGWVAEGSPSGAALIRASGNRGPAGAAGVEAPLAARKGVPAIGSGGPADAGSGPGSALSS